MNILSFYIINGRIFYMYDKGLKKMKKYIKRYKLYNETIYVFYKGKANHKCKYGDIWDVNDLYMA